jgi:serine kinase of HPr protein (carbohydrate metabolism regulator)
MTASPTIHASAVLVGAKAVLIRGPSGSGKSSLAWELIQATNGGRLAFARLVGDDRVHVRGSGFGLLVRPHENLFGLIEIRGLGLRRLEYEPLAVVGLVVDLEIADAERLPAPDARQITLEGIVLPRIGLAAGARALPAVLAFLGTEPGGD